ncbi:GAF domain-containing protein [Palleronia aestuarii]|uniref:GAF domain-containing protein n=1 Tax=Palleronia aestuarii TaxID=568105 RepID=A0A2W7QDB7_9RHOB|nr:GAF domain-containing protein [Palleronia aestuarii]PZX19859.1 GAF domain-containing protein [Palleronia aestuarii]
MTNDFISALALGDDQPDATFAGLQSLAANIVGFRLFTLLKVDTEARLVRRIHSNEPDAYPTSGTKPILDNDWTARVLDHGETAVMNDAAEVAEVFSDHELIASLGCASCINVPVVVGGRVLGLVNCLHEAGHYTPERVRASEELKLPGAAAFLFEALRS